MRFPIRSLVLTSAALFATAAFAADKAVVTVPFNFESHGQAFPAGQYEVSLDSHENVITMSNMTNTAQTVMWNASPADYENGSPVARLKFDDAGYTHGCILSNSRRASLRYWTLPLNTTMRAAQWLRSAASRATLVTKPASERSARALFLP